MGLCSTGTSRCHRHPEPTRPLSPGLSRCSEPPRSSTRPLGHAVPATGGQAGGVAVSGVWDRAQHPVLGCAKSCAPCTRRAVELGGCSMSEQSRAARHRHRGLLQLSGPWGHPRAVTSCWEPSLGVGPMHNRQHQPLALSSAFNWAPKLNFQPRSPCLLFSKERRQQHQLLSHGPANGCEQGGHEVLGGDTRCCQHC